MTLDRRRFLQSAALAVLAMVSRSGAAGCRGLVRTDFRAQSDDADAGLPLTPAERDILRLASLAPSGHNAQPWTVRVTEPGRWIVGSERERWLGATDPANRELMLSVGAFLHNLEIAAESHGLRVTPDIVAAGNNDPEIVRLALAPGGSETDWRPKIETRRTIRTRLRGGALKAEDRGWIEGLAAGHAFYLPPDSPQARYLAEATIESNRVQASRREVMEELAEWIRFSDGEARRHRNGLTPESMEIGGLAGWYVRHFFDRESVLEPSFAEQGAKRAEEQARYGGGWLVLTSPDGGVPSLLDTGARLARIWLEVRSRSIALHPMSQVFEEAPWRERIAADLGLPGVPQFVLRAAYVDRYPEPVSLRMPLHRFVTA